MPDLTEISWKILYILGQKASVLPLPFTNCVYSIHITIYNGGINHFIVNCSSRKRQTVKFELSPRSRQITMSVSRHLVFTGQMPFLNLNAQTTALKHLLCVTHI